MSIPGGLAVEKTGYGRYEVVILNHKGIGRNVLPLGTASAEIEGAGKAKQTQRALRQLVKTNTERQRGGGKEKKGGEREELRAASAPVT